MTDKVLVEAAAEAIARAASERFGHEFVSSPTAVVWREYARAALKAADRLEAAAQVEEDT